MFDLDADPLAIAAHFANDAILSPLFRKRPGLRLPGALDVFEIAVRAVLGQKVSVAAARTLGARLVERFGAEAESLHAGLTRHFPDAARIAHARTDQLAAIGLTLGRARALQSIARAVDEGSLALDAGADAQVVCEKLEQIAGIGRWTAQYVALRGLSWPDAFPDSDLGIRKALGGIPASACRKLAERWRPWRAYAAVQLWASL
jgi:AraC family transcriptional regulator of adaptative response / DNA-3-methyladenine glycosylase II